jgi:hypothetical protein
MGMLIVHQRGELFRLTVNSCHTFILQVNVVDKLDAQDGNDEQKDQQHKTLKKTHALSLNPKAITASKFFKTG